MSFRDTTPIPESHLSQLLWSLVDLSREIHAHVPFDSPELGGRDGIIQLIDDPNDPFDRSRYDPGHITASMFVVSPDHSLAAMVLHKKMERWLQPGGHVDPTDETVLDGALREVREEAGLHLQRDQATLFDLDIHPIPPTAGEPAHHHFDIRYLIEAQITDLTPGPDVSDAAWKSIHIWDNGSSDDGLRRVMRKLMRL